MNLFDAVTKNHLPLLAYAKTCECVMIGVRLGVANTLLGTVDNYM